MQLASCMEISGGRRPDSIETLGYWFLGKRGKREVPRILCSLKIVHKRTSDVPVIPFEGAGKGRRQEEWTPRQTPREDFSLTWGCYRCGCHFYTCFTKTPAPATLASWLHLACATVFQDLGLLDLFSLSALLWSPNFHMASCHSDSLK